MRELLLATQHEHQEPLLRAAKFLYYYASELLKRSPDNQPVQRLHEQVAQILLTQESAPAQQAVLQQLVADYQRADVLRREEMEFKSVYVATIGLENVGKGIVTSYLEEKYGFNAHPLSDRLTDIALIFGHQPPLSRDTFYTVSREIKNVLGEAILIHFAESVFAEINKPNRILFDGIRKPEEAVAVMNKESDGIRAAIIAIITGEETEEDDLIARYIRSLYRGSQKDPKENTEAEFDAFKQKSDREAKGIKIAMQEYATHTVVNIYGKKEETFAQLDQIMKELGVEPVQSN
jgi:hypothetical protein